MTATHTARSGKAADGVHGPTPREAELKALAERAGRELEDASALEILQWAADTFGERFCVTSSMEDAVVAHLASRARPGVDVVFLDTGYHFPETLGTRDAVEAVMDVRVLTLTPKQTVAEQDAEYGPRLHDRDPDLCCFLRKVKPLQEGLAGYEAWATGLRRDESPTRAGTPVVGWDEKRRKVKISPSPAGRRTTSTPTPPSTACSPTRS